MHVALAAAAGVVVLVAGAGLAQGSLGDDVLTSGGAGRVGAAAVGLRSQARRPDVAGAAAAGAVVLARALGLALEAFAHDLAVRVDGGVAADVAGACVVCVCQRASGPVDCEGSKTLPPRPVETTGSVAGMVWLLFWSFPRIVVMMFDGGASRSQSLSSSK